MSVNLDLHNELVTELVRLCGIEQSFATAYSSEENGIVERANQEVLRHLRAFLFDSRVQDASLDPQRTQVVTENLFQCFPRHL